MKSKKDSLIAVLGYLKANRTAPVGARIPAIALNTLQAVIDSLDEDTVPVKASRLRGLSSALGHPTMIAAIDGDTPADALVEVAAMTLLDRSKSLCAAPPPAPAPACVAERFTDAEMQAAPGLALDSGEFVPAGEIPFHPV